MKLYHLIFGTATAKSAPYYWVQHGHRETAVKSAIAIFDHHQKIEHGEWDKPWDIEMIDTVHDWLVETLIQGAYLREYHTWERDVKTYINDQRKWNAKTEADWRSGRKDMVSRVRICLSDFDVTIDDRIMQAIDSMRERINRMKHEEGMLLETFVTTDDYFTAHRAIEQFWERLTEIETPIMSFSEVKSGR